ncbi:aspartyl-phosphate phosphatase Spo0E family protein [Oceanobacillus piezotolerans]|uniref:Aspartyl-phosphate phosphatase Spo0E family protein n=1 Tax=Oceanobacillus piezotolerans TaxID=2448030 RepID=A0A498DTW2_9BACI|nr:aspartyl-phosphate phosphatase Spo0E family protein [Oceanobacillus piezotolerans]RLL48297.1 aspartyl-phosphate phosphatase Spo0E family protein [Oceanobacillus piezotolerans]
MEQVHAAGQSKLPSAILEKKRKMIQLGMKYGLADKRTVNCSQELDDLLNKFTDDLSGSK